MKMHLFRPRINDDLMTSRLYCDQTFYSAFKKDLKRAQNEVLIESPFMAMKRTSDMLPVLKTLISKGVNVRINTRNPKHHEAAFEGQAWRAINALRDVGVDVKFYDDYRHRKLAAIDRTVL